MTSLESLRVIGVTKISSATHISKKFLTALLDEDFESIKPITFKGFIVILEREYKIDFSDVIEEYAKHNKEEKTKLWSDDVFVEEKPASYYKYIVIVFLVALIVFVVLKQDMLNGESNTTKNEKTQSVIDIKKVIKNKLETNESLIQDENKNQIISNNLKQNSVKKIVKKNQTIVKKELLGEKKLIIRPQSDLWFGVINMQTDAHSSWRGTVEKVLNAQMNYLLFFGHGNLEIQTAKKVHKFNSDKKIYATYINGVFEKISRRDFISKNGGKIW
jgi:hypothetical protein